MAIGPPRGRPGTRGESVEDGHGSDSGRNAGAVGEGAFGAQRVRRGGYAFVALPMAVFGSSSSTRSSTRSTSASSTGGSSGRSGRSSARTNYHDALHDPLLPERAQEHVEYTLVVVPLEMALGLCWRVVVNQRIRGRTSSAPRSTSRRSPPPPRSRRSRSSSSAPTASSTDDHRRQHRPGSATRAPRSGRSSASTPGRRRAR